MKRCVVAAALLGAAAAAQGQVLFGVGGFSSFGVQTLYRIDASTGAATAVGSTGLRQIADIAWDESNRRLLALTVDADLYALDLFTGASTLVAARAGLVPEGALAVRADGALFTTESDVLAQLSPSTAALTAIGTGLGVPANDVSGLVFGPTGLLAYAKNGSLADSILSIDAATGAATVVGLTGFDSASGVGGLAVTASGEVLLSDGSSLFTVDATTGAASLVGAFGVGGMSGITVIPAPGATVLVLAGVLVARRRR